MKVTYRIPAKEPYGYIELEREAEDSSIPGIKALLDGYDEVVEAYKAEGMGLTDKEFNDCLDKYLTQKTMTSDEYAKMNEVQKTIVQAIKRSYKRTTK